MTDKRLKCVIEDKIVRMCCVLDEVCEHYSNTAKGIQYMLLTNLNTGKPSRSIVLVRSGKHKKKGIILNHCPFCGENISAHLNADEADAVALPSGETP